MRIALGKTNEIKLQKNHYALRGWEYRVNGFKLGMVYKRILIGQMDGFKEDSIIYTFQSDINILSPEQVALLKLGIKNKLGAWIAIFKTKKEAQKALRKYLIYQLYFITPL